MNPIDIEIKKILKEIQDIREYGFFEKIRDVKNEYGSFKYNFVSELKWIDKCRIIDLELLDNKDKELLKRMLDIIKSNFITKIKDAKIHKSTKIMNLLDVMPERIMDEIALYRKIDKLYEQELINNPENVNNHMYDEISKITQNDKYLIQLLNEISNDCSYNLSRYKYKSLIEKKVNIKYNKIKYLIFEMLEEEFISIEKINSIKEKIENEHREDYSMILDNQKLILELIYESKRFELKKEDKNYTTKINYINFYKSN